MPRAPRRRGAPTATSKHCQQRHRLRGQHPWRQTRIVQLRLRATEARKLTHSSPSGCHWGRRRRGRPCQTPRAEWRLAALWHHLELPTLEDRIAIREVWQRWYRETLPLCCRSRCRRCAQGVRVHDAQQQGDFCAAVDKGQANWDIMTIVTRGLPSVPSEASLPVPHPNGLPVYGKEDPAHRCFLGIRDDEAQVQPSELALQSPSGP